MGIAVVGWCTGLGIEDPADCLFYGEGDDRNTLRAAPQSNNNLVALNKLSGNAGEAPPPGGALPPADLVYAQIIEGFVPPGPPSGNCFEKNKPKNGLTTYGATAFPPPAPPGEPLPTDGC